MQQTRFRHDRPGSSVAAWDHPPPPSRAAGLAVEGAGGQVFAAVVAIALIFGAFRLFTTPRGERYMVG
ncbi:MAG: hypothetical protein WD100_13755, partial [Tistlia sp.]